MRQQPRTASRRDDAPSAPRTGPAPRFRLRGMLVSWLPTLVLPVVRYQVLVRRGVARIPALTANGDRPAAAASCSNGRGRGA